MTGYADCNYCGGEVVEKKSTMIIGVKDTLWLSVTSLPAFTANVEKNILGPMS